MEKSKKEEMRIVFESLIDTFVKYLKPDPILNDNSIIARHKNQFYSDEPNSESVLENMLLWIHDDDTQDDAIFEFTKTLDKLAKNPAFYNGNEAQKQRMSQYMEPLISIIDGKLIQALSKDEVNYVVNVMCEKSQISEESRKRALEKTHPYDCCLEMFRGIKRRKYDWPFIFIDSVSQKRPELVKLQEPCAGLLTSQKIPERSSNNQTSTAISDLPVDNLIHEASRILDSEEGFSEISTDSKLKAMFHLKEGEENDPAWQMMLDSGAVSKNQITTDPPPEIDKRWKNLSLKTFSDEDSSSDEENETPVKGEAQSLPLRKYQKELAEDALKGLNTIICAPTGSGKTRVAVHIIQDHLEKSAGQSIKPKVAFLARTVPLVMQQYKSLDKILGKKYEVSSLTGDSEYSMHLHMLLPDNDVIVMTPRILENHLKRKCLPHLGVFSMLVFDECHHTRKGEPYNTLMYSYLKIKKQSKVKLPQIVGLTASIGIEKAVQDDEAVESILQVCGNLDADCISAVEKHKEELREKVPVPKELLFKLKERENDHPVERIINIMRKLERNVEHHAKELKNEELNSLLKRIPSDKKSQPYGQWAVKMRNLAKSLPRKEDRETNIPVRNLIIIADYLTAYNVALETHDLVQLKDVMDYLEKCFVKYRENEKRTSGESTFYDYFDGLKELVKGRFAGENPNLILLRDKLKEYLIDKGDKSCGIIFVRTRALTEALASWLNRCGMDELTQLKATVFTGTAASVEQGGMTQAEQEEIISRFRSGEVRLLIATSVGEEGLDIPECNLVIKYNHVGNEVTTVQTRGRSRKHDGMSILLAMDKTLRRERINQEKAKMMERAITTIHQMKQSEMRERTRKHQENILKEEEILELVKQQEEKRLLRKPFNMVCHLCRKLVIKCEDIKTILGTHRVVVNSEILSQVKVLPYKDAKYFDDVRMIGSVKCWCEPEHGKHCSNKLGSMMIYNKIPFVVLGIKYFGFEQREKKATSLGLEFYNQWKRVPYAIDEITKEDFQRYLPEQEEAGNNSGQNDHRKKDSSVNNDDDDDDDDDDRGNKPLSKHAKLDQVTGSSPLVNQNAVKQGGDFNSHTDPKRVQETSSLTELKKFQEGVVTQKASSITEPKRVQDTDDEAKAGNASTDSGVGSHEIMVPTGGVCGSIKQVKPILSNDVTRSHQSSEVSAFHSNEKYHNTQLATPSEVDRAEDMRKLLIQTQNILDKPLSDFSSFHAPSSHDSYQPPQLSMESTADSTASNEASAPVDAAEPVQEPGPPNGDDSNEREKSNEEDTQPKEVEVQQNENNGASQSLFNRNPSRRDSDESDHGGRSNLAGQSSLFHQVL